MNPSTDPSRTPPPAARGLSRRQLVRAGLGAAPVLAVLKSNTVLAGPGDNAITTSAFASLQANQGRVSNARVVSRMTVITPAQWASQASPLKKKKFRDCGFVAPAYGRFGHGTTLGQVLEFSEGDADTLLARSVVASYLTALQYGDDREVVALSTTQCKAIWNGRGSWSPFAGAHWDYPQTMAYFDTIYGGHHYS
ncbi:MAG: hypothetical protein LWW82_01745 [Comamonadaceae bacterium]|jgi:hypothetical protein|nr:hypothetical protein [Comamonadaceae bacterium]